MRNLPFILALLLSVISCSRREEYPIKEATMVTVSEEFVDSCAADFDIRYGLFSRYGEVYVAYYTPDHILRVAKRDSTGVWHYNTLPDTVNYDSHRYLNIAVDRDTIIHLSGNMHTDPLVYYRSSRPGDIFSLNRDTMTNINEDSVTYPEFLVTDSMMVFHYRNGQSGDGSTYINEYDVSGRIWRKKSNYPLFDGKHKANSYFKGPFYGPDGLYHLVWCWRDEPECETNHGLYYARTADLLTWQTASGETKMNPITPFDSMFLVDDIKIGEGLINGGFVLGFEPDFTPFLAYHKYDSEGNTNVFLATLNAGKWHSRQITRWKWRWNFLGRGSIPFLLEMDDARSDSLSYSIMTRRSLSRGWFSEPAMEPHLITFNRTDSIVTEELFSPYPRKFDKAGGKEMSSHMEPDRNILQRNEREHYLLDYETAVPRRDKRGDKLLPAATSLRLLLMKTKQKDDVNE